MPIRQILPSLSVARLFVLFSLCGQLLFAQDSTNAPVGVNYAKLGKKADFNTLLTLSNGEKKSLKDLAGDKPIVLSLVYYQCENVCSPMLNAITSLINKSPKQLLPGDDYKLVTLSFDEREGPELAKGKKASYLSLLDSNKQIKQDDWFFLTSDSASIRSVANSVGFGYERFEDGFSHGSGLIVISPNGVIARYMRGQSFLPLDLMMAVTDARTDKWAPTIQKFVKFCFVKDPEGKGYYFDFLKIVGIMILTIIFTVVLGLTWIIKRKQTKNTTDNEVSNG